MPELSTGLTAAHSSAWDALLRQAAAGIGESIPVPGSLIRAVADDAERMRQELGRLRGERHELLVGCRAFIAAMRAHARTPAPEPFVRALVEALGIVVYAVHKAEGRIDATER